MNLPEFIECHFDSLLKILTLTTWLSKVLPIFPPRKVIPTWTLIALLRYDSLKINTLSSICKIQGFSILTELHKHHNNLNNTFYF